MRKFNIRKVLDGLTAGSSSASQQPPPQQHTPGGREPEVQETLQSEHFQLCKVNGACSPPGVGSLEGGSSGFTGASWGTERRPCPHRELRARSSSSRHWLGGLFWRFTSPYSFSCYSPLFFFFSHAAIIRGCFQRIILIFNPYSLN